MQTEVIRGWPARAAEVMKLPWIRQERTPRLDPAGGPDMKVEVNGGQALASGVPVAKLVRDEDRR